MHMQSLLKLHEMNAITHTHVWIRADVLYQHSKTSMASPIILGLKVSKFELQLHYYIHFWANTLGKVVNLLIPSAMG